MNRRELDGLEVDILSYLLENGEKRFIEIAQALYLNHRKSFTDENHFNVVLSRKLDSLLKEHHLKKKVLGHKNVRYYIPQEKREVVVREVKNYRKLEEIKKLSPEEIERLDKELEHYKRLTRIDELEKLPLPLPAVIEKLCSMGFKIEDVQDKVCTYYPEYYHPEPVDLNLINVKFLSDDIEVKLIPQSEVEGWFDHSEMDDFEKMITLMIEVNKKFGGKWQLLTPDPVNGYYVIGAYKELLRLYAMESDYRLLKWKEKFNLNEEDWQKIGLVLKEVDITGSFLNEHEKMGKIDDFLTRYAYSKRSDALLKLKIHYMERGFSADFAENAAKQDLENFQKEKPEFYTIF
jgi:hypothetical protein